MCRKDHTDGPKVRCLQKITMEWESGNEREHGSHWRRGPASQVHKGQPAVAQGSQPWAQPDSALGPPALYTTAKKNNTVTDHWVLAETELCLLLAFLFLIAYPKQKGKSSTIAQRLSTP